MREIKFRDQNQYTGFDDSDGNEIYENDTLIYQWVYQPRIKKVKVEFNELVGGWWAGDQMLCDVLMEQHNEEWKKSKNFKSSENHKVKIFKVQQYETP